MNKSKNWIEVNPSGYIVLHGFNNLGSYIGIHISHRDGKLLRAFLYDTYYTSKKISKRTFCDGTINISYRFACHNNIVHDPKLYSLITIFDLADYCYRKDGHNYIAK